MPTAGIAARPFHASAHQLPETEVEKQILPRDNRKGYGDRLKLYAPFLTGINPNCDGRSPNVTVDDALVDYLLRIVAATLLTRRYLT